jgi:inosine-uridine nucleoside N-ribohydrolase
MRWVVVFAAISALFPLGGWAHAGEPAPAARRVLIDQDASGPAGTDLQSVLMLLSAPGVHVEAIVVTAGDGFAPDGTADVLRMLERTGHGDVKVAQGAERPLVNSREETAAWESQYGEFAYKGAWNAGRRTRPRIPTALSKVPEHGAQVIVDTLRRYPGQVTLWVGGPLTTVALALALEPRLPELAKELVLMGGGFNVDRGGNHRINGRREFNWWWDPEATRMVMSAPWKSVTLTPVDISVKTHYTPDLAAKLAQVDTPAARYMTWAAPPRPPRKPRPGAGEPVDYMWDEIAAAAWLDPTLITRKQELYVNVDIDHGASYGQTLFVEKTVKVPGWWKLATVQWDLDTERFYKMYVDLLGRKTYGDLSR